LVEELEGGDGGGCSGCGMLQGNRVVWYWPNGRGVR